MLSRSMQNMKALCWVIAMLAMLQPFAAHCCVCKSDAAQDASVTGLDDCCQGHVHVGASSSSSCGHEHDQPGTAEAASEVCDISLYGYGPCSCPPTCQCQLRHTAPTMRAAEVNVRHLDEVADWLTVLDGGTCPRGTPPTLWQRPVRTPLDSSASCCALLCRFVI